MTFSKGACVSYAIMLLFVGKKNATKEKRKKMSKR